MEQAKGPSHRNHSMMNKTAPALSCTLLGSTLLGLMAVLGCGDDTGLDKRYPVYGMVTYDGKPVEDGQISFIAVDKNKQRDANGFINKGKYSLTTATPDDGALPGEYSVTITAKQADNTKVIETVTKYGGGGRQQDIGKATAKAKNLVPAKFQLPETSQLKYTVKPQSNQIDIDLKD
jgi:hypothetical protein